MKLAVFLPNWVGDAVMATPALRALRTKFPAPEHEIVGVLRPYVADVLAGTDLVDRTLIHEPHGTLSSRRGLGFVRRLRAERFDVALLLPNSLRSAWLARLSGAKRRVGFARDGRGPLLTDRLSPPPKGEPTPAIDEYLRLAKHLGCERTSRRMELATGRDDELALERFWRKHDPRWRSRGVIGLNPGGAFGAAKHWPVEAFAELAARIDAELDRTALVLCGPSEREAARRIVELANRPGVFSLADETPSLGLTKAAVKHADLLVTTDSGPRHFAPPFDVPVVTLFGPTHIAWSETFYARAVHLQMEVDCGPCQQRTCPLGHHRCMRELTPSRVFHAVADLLARQSAAPRTRVA